MRSWIFVIGVATMGVASIIGLNFATIRINHRIELIAEMPASSSIAPLQPEKRGDFYYARSIGAFPLRSRCASCHAAAKTAPSSPFVCRHAFSGL